MYQVFLSRPTTVSAQQQSFCDALEAMLAERNCAPRTLGRTDYPNKAPVTAVRALMTECDGVIVLGLRQLQVVEAVAKPGTREQTRIRDRFWPTPWNQLEAGVAFALHLPLMIIKESGVEGGVFDADNTDRFVHQAEMTGEWLRRQQFLQPLNEWLAEIVKRA